VSQGLVTGDDGGGRRRSFGTWVPPGDKWQRQAAMVMAGWTAGVRVSSGGAKISNLGIPTSIIHT
jgi:hypothetical protein